MAPIRKGDGTPLEIPGVSEVRSGDGRVFFEGDAIPDSVVSRPDDNDSFSADNRIEGVQIELKSDWPSIGCRISNNSDIDSLVLRDNDQNRIETVDVSGLSAGDAVTFDDVDLQNGQNYQITTDEDNTGETFGFRDDGDDFPYTSEDVDITDGINNSDLGSTVRVVNDIGNTGFD